MTSAKATNLKAQMCGEFSKIFDLCNEILQKAQKESLIQVSLDTLLRFLHWIPLGYIFETNLIEMLATRVCSNYIGLFSHMTSFIVLGSARLSKYDCEMFHRNWWTGSSGQL